MTTSDEMLNTIEQQTPFVLIHVSETDRIRNHSNTFIPRIISQVIILAIPTFDIGLKEKKNRNHNRFIFNHHMKTATSHHTHKLQKGDGRGPASYSLLILSFILLFFIQLILCSREAQARLKKDPENLDSVVYKAITDESQRNLIQ